MKNKKPVFTFVTHYLSGGGAERAIAVLASEIAEQGICTNIIVHYKTGNEYFTSPKVNIYFDKEFIYTNNSVIEKIRKIIRIRNQIKKYKTDFVIPFLDICTIHTFIATRMLNIGFISTIRVYPGARKGMIAWISDWIAGNSMALYAQTEEEKYYYPKKVQKKTFILPNPVSIEMFLKKHIYNKKMRVLVTAGRLTEQKNFMMLIKAAEMLVVDYPDIIVNIFGDGEQMEELSVEIEKRGLVGVVNLMGRCENMADSYNTSDVFVMTSEYEGMPNSLMEAMAIGLPCISTDCKSGPSELIENDVNGFLIPINDINTLVNKIKFLFENTNIARKLGENAREKMKTNYTPQIIAERFVNECMKFR